MNYKSVAALVLFLAVVLTPGHSSLGRARAASSEEDLHSDTITRALHAYHQRNYDRALTLLRPYETMANPPAAVYFLLGKIYYAHNDFNRAASFSDRALSGLDDPKIRNQLVRLRDRARQLAGINFERRTYRHFHVLIPRSLSVGVADRVNHRIMAAYRGVGGDLGLFPNTRFTVILYRPSSFRRVVGAPAWSSGIFDSKIHVLYDEERNPPYRRSTLIHEYTHALVYSLAQNNVPVWFNEGLATFEEIRHARNGSHKAALSSFDPRHSPPSFQELNRLFQSSSSRREARRAYQNSLSMIRYLHQRQGLGQMERLLETAGRTGSFPEAFRRVMGHELSEFHRRWSRWIAEEAA